jgi:hypothetical protein
MENLVVWFVALGIGAVVAAAIFFGAPRLLQRFNQGGDVVAPPTVETLNVEPRIANDKAQGVKWPTWKQLPPSTKTIMAVGAVTILLGGAGVTWLLTPRDLNCASKAAQELVAQIARENGAMMENIASRFIRQNPLPLPPVRSCGALSPP